MLPLHEKNFMQKMNCFCILFHCSTQGREIKYSGDNSSHETDPVFSPRTYLAFGYCRCLRLSVCICPSVRLLITSFVYTITLVPFKLRSPNLDQRWETPWLESLLFGDVIYGWPKWTKSAKGSTYEKFHVRKHTRIKSFVYKTIRVSKVSCIK